MYSMVCIGVRVCVYVSYVHSYAERIEYTANSTRGEPQSKIEL